MTPAGFATLARIRLSGKRPRGFIVVTEAKDIASTARRRDLCPLVFEPGKSYDWRVLKALDVRLITRLKRDTVAPVCMAILEADPRSFWATYDDGEAFEHEWVIRAAR